MSDKQFSENLDRWLTIDPENQPEATVPERVGYDVISEITLSAIRSEAIRAHLRHGNQSMMYGSENKSLRILIEEVGEVSKEMNELALTHITTSEYLERVEMELIQVAAMAATWIEKLHSQPFMFYMQ